VTYDDLVWLAVISGGDETDMLCGHRQRRERGVVENEARAALEQAVELAPHNVELRRRLADLLLKTGDEAAAVEQHQTLVRTFPEVPKYRVDLGRTLLLAGDEGAAQEQFEEATELNPLSDEVHASVGDALRNAGRLRGAAARYERAVELRPKNQLHHLELGKIYSALSTADGWDEEYFDKAEETLVRATRLEPVPGSRASKEAALLALGNLYYRWDRQEEAITTYEQVLGADPDSQEARSRLEELQG
jgi:tetratricopeptide (TPR) repeat protein